MKFSTRCVHDHREHQCASTFVKFQRRHEREFSYNFGKALIILLVAVLVADGGTPSAADAFGRGATTLSIISDSNGTKRATATITTRATAESTSTLTTNLDDFQSDDETRQSWSSFLAVDPSKILSTMVNHAGLLIPDSIENDLKILARVCSVDLAELSVLERRLILRNFTVSSNSGDRNTLSVGKVHLRWDSYLKPCLDIEVEDVHFVVEFTNLLLTRNNWHELQDQGFPPPLLTDFSEDGTDFTAHLRIGSLDFSGNLTAELRSRPLDAHLHVLKFDLDSLDDFNLRIREVVKAKDVRHSRRGITTEELYEMLKLYFHEKIQHFLSSCLHEITHNPVSESKVLRNVEHFFKEAADTILTYSMKATNYKFEKVQSLVSVKLAKWGVAIPLSELHSHANNLNSSMWGFSNQRLKQLRLAFQTADNKLKEFWENQRIDKHDDKAIFFPDCGLK